MIIVEYLHLALQQVFSCDKEYPTDTEMYWAFQQSNDPTTLGFKYERDFREADATQPETV